jgi:VWFA-related protein
MKKSFGLLVFLFCALAINNLIFSQIVERKKPELKDFGSSLKRTPEENLAPPKVKKTEASTNDEVIRIDTNMVMADFLVLDKKGQAIYGLTKEDFIVTEDNQPQEIQTFTLGDDSKIPRSIVLIIDYSGSQLPYIERSVEAAKLLVDKLRPNDLMALVTDDVELITQFTSDKNLLKESLNSLKENALVKRKLGKSKQFSSLYAVLNEMFDEEDVRPIILFQTDGDQLGALKGGYADILGNPLSPSFPGYIANFSFNDLLNIIENKRTTIYTIVPGVKLLGLSREERTAKMREEIERRRKIYAANPNPRPSPPRPPQPTPQQMEEMKKIVAQRAELMKKHFPNGLPDPQETMAGLSKFSGGWIDFLEKPEDADVVYSRIFSEINTRYLIGYYPTNEAKDGKRRIVKIEVKNQPDYIVWGRKTYIAPLID